MVARAIPGRCNAPPARYPPTVLMKTYVATPATRERNWVVIDASVQTLGRLATQIANTLRG